MDNGWRNQEQHTHKTGSGQNIEKNKAGGGCSEKQEARDKDIGSIPLQPSFIHRSSGSTKKFGGDLSSTLRSGKPKPSPWTFILPVLFSFCYIEYFLSFIWNIKHFGAYRHTS